MDKTTFWYHTAPSFEMIENYDTTDEHVSEDHDWDEHGYSLTSSEEILASGHISEHSEVYNSVEFDVIEVRVFSTVRISSENTFDKIEKYFQKKR